MHPWQTQHQRKPVVSHFLLFFLHPRVDPQCFCSLEASVYPKHLLIFPCVRPRAVNPSLLKRQTVSQGTEEDGKHLEPIEEIAESAGSLLFPIEMSAYHQRSSPARSCFKDESAILSGSGGERALLTYSVRYLGQRDANLRLHNSRRQARVCRKGQLLKLLGARRWEVGLVGR